MHAHLQTNATAFVGQGIDGRLNAFAGTDNNSATSRRQLGQRRKHRPAIVNGSVGLDNRELAEMMMNAQRRRLIEPLNVRIRRARGETPIVAGVRRTIAGLAQSNLNAMFQHAAQIGGC